MPPSLACCSSAYVALNNTSFLFCLETYGTYPDPNANNHSRQSLGVFARHDALAPEISPMSEQGKRLHEANGNRYLATRGPLDAGFDSTALYT